MSTTSDLLSNSDESFSFLCFGFVTSLLTLVWMPSIISFIWNLRSYQAFCADLKSMWEWVTYLPSCLLMALLRPACLTTALRTLSERRSFAWRIFVPVALRRTIRPHIVLLVLFWILLPIVLYQKLSFDPYEILELPAGADEKVVRKQYRKLSMMYHPDKNRTKAARVQYTRVRRAYKMLADPQAFEDELQTTSTGAAEISVALPRFLLDPEYRRYTAPLLLGTLFLFPVALIWMLMSSEADKALREVVERVLWMQSQYDYFYRMLGEPEGATTERVEDLLAKWTVDDNQYEVAMHFIQLCNDDMRGQLDAIFPLIRNNKHYVQNFQLFCGTNKTKLDLLTQLAGMCDASGHPPARNARPLVTKLQQLNKQLASTMEALYPTDRRLQASLNDTLDEELEDATRPKRGSRRQG